jgi:hypothetical protein
MIMIAQEPALLWGLFGDGAAAKRKSSSVFYAPFMKAF